MTRLNIKTSFFVLIFISVLCPSGVKAELGARQVTEIQNILTQATQAAEGITNPWIRLRIFDGIVSVYIKIGELNSALAIAERGDNVSRDSTLNAISRAQIEIGQVDEAINTTTEMELGPSKAMSLQNIAPKVFNKEQKAKVLELLKRALMETLSPKSHPTFYDSNFLIYIVEAQAMAGDRKAARDTIEKMFFLATSTPKSEDKANVLGDTAEAQAKMGDFSKALATARSIQIEDDLNFALRRIAKAQANIGNIENALYAAREINDPYDRDRALEGIVEVQASAGDIQEAFKTVRSIKTSKLEKADGLIRIAQAQSKKLNSRSASKTLLQAIEVAENIRSASSRAKTFGRIAYAQEEIQGREKATITIQQGLKAIQEISEIKEKDSPLLRIVEAQAKTNLIDEGLKVIGSMKEDWFKDRGYFHIAQAQARAGNIEGALRTASLNKGIDFQWRGHSLQQIGKIQAQMGDKKGALAWATKKTFPSDRASAFLGIAQGLLYLGNQ